MSILFDNDKKSGKLEVLFAINPLKMSVLFDINSWKVLVVTVWKCEYFLFFDQMFYYLMF